MKTIKLKSLEMTDFKAVKNRVINFTDNTEIIGDNGKGKSTVYNAFTWLLYGKNQELSTKQTVYPLDENNNIIHHKEPTVTGIFDIDNQEYKFKRTLKEKWTKKRGELNPELTGNETKYWINDVPVNEREYSQRINEIISEDLFKLLTMPTYFNSLGRDVRREFLINLVNIQDSEVAKGNKDFENLLNNLTGKTLKGLQTYIKSKIATIKKERDKIEPQIKGILRVTPESLDWEQLEKELSDTRKQLDKLDEQIKDKTKVSEEYYIQKEKLQKDIYNLQEQERNIKFDLESESIEKLSLLEQKQQKLNGDISLLNNSIGILESDIKTAEQDLKNKNVEINELRQRFIQLSKQEADLSDIATSCPVCKREYDKDNIEQQQEQAKAEFNKRKVKQQKEINDKGIKLKSELKKIQTDIFDKKELLDIKKKGIETLKYELSELKKEIQTTEKQQENIQPNEQLKIIQKNLEKLNKQLTGIEQPKVDVSNLEQQQKEIKIQIDEIKKQLNIKDEITKNEKEIKRLQDEGRKLNETLTEYEKEQFTIENFITSKMTMLEEKLNNMFSLVKFKMFRKQMNGGIEQICETLINGVAYSTDLNTGAKINAGIDIINTFSRVKGITAPIFVDNAESVSKIIDTDSQIIKLIKVTGKEFEVINKEAKPKKLKQESTVTKVKKETKKPIEQPKTNGLLF